ncbi:Fructosamine/Ketosamine-3-kinase [[Leptolyngbya] sp. PCC 7376]|uniref:fructosamine kinase family protein n=1 Tax=[Leptolyngbya] sp. PCC 7376 TaxID=111781 RepID=UPI00029ED2BB|nr:fructosamine kinase family protein [[Leptolyngbya] sp. PCC 7376]AFY39632.1 Fructosamine/Ketosamine-3-kinase [[Leptolyngbya] sp. PCC 7376]
MSTFWREISDHITAITGHEFELEKQRSVGGGCINEGYQIEGSSQRYFVKLNRPNHSEMFAAEALGLQQMFATKSILVPQPICWGETQSNSYIVMEWLELGSGGAGAWQEMGRQLAAMHKAGGSEQFGWDRNNTIGSTPQINTWCDDWAEFWAETRIGYQLRLANRNGGGFPDMKQVAARIKEILSDVQPQPSLVHGDLWSGNAAIAADGTPVIFDPAAYYGDREVDIAMTELFGGFPPSFYKGYNEVWPLDSGYGDRRDLYNLYHVLNHFNLFGGGYGSQAQRIIQRLI